MLCFIGCREYNGKVYLYTDDRQIWCVCVEGVPGYPEVGPVEVQDVPTEVVRDYCYVVDTGERKLERAMVERVAVRVEPVKA